MAAKLDPVLVKRVHELELASRGKTHRWAEIALTINKEFPGSNYSRDTICNVWKRYKHGYTAPDKYLPPTEENSESTQFVERCVEILRSKNTSVNPPTEVWRNVFIEAQGLRAMLSDRELHSEVTIPATSPIAISWLGDWHIGSPHTDYEKLYSDIDFIKANPRLFCCVSGDRTDMFVPGFKDAAAVTGQLVPGDLQLSAMHAILTELDKSIIAAIGGNHDIMAKRKTGVDTEFWVRKGMSFSYMPHGGLLTLTVGSQIYKILWKHTYRFQSALNKFNSHHRMLELLEPTADVVVTEHLHDPGIESIEKGTQAGRRTVISIRTGAYKIDDGYSMDFYKEGRPAPQTVVFYPDRKKILALHGAESMQDAAIYLNGLQTNKP